MSPLKVVSRKVKNDTVPSRMHNSGLNGRSLNEEAALNTRETVKVRLLDIHYNEVRALHLIIKTATDENAE